MKIKRVLITFVIAAIFAVATGCGEKEVADTTTEDVIATEKVNTTERNAATEELEMETETETEKEIDMPVLFRIVVTNPEGAYIGDQPSDKEYNSVLYIKCDEEFDVYKEYMEFYAIRIYDL